MNISSHGVIFEFEQPSVLPKAGDTIVVQKAFITLRRESYKPGDTLEIIGRTDEAPFGVRASTGNLKVKGKDGAITVWTNIELGLSEGWLSYDI